MERRETVVVPVPAEGVVSEGEEVVDLFLPRSRSDLCCRDSLSSYPTTQQVFGVGAGWVSRAAPLVRRAHVKPSGDRWTLCLPSGVVRRLGPVRVPGVEEVVAGRVGGFAW